MSFYIINKIITEIETTYRDDFLNKPEILISQETLRKFNSIIGLSGLPYKSLYNDLENELLRRLKIKEVVLIRNTVTNRIEILNLKK